MYVMLCLNMVFISIPVWTYFLMALLYSTVSVGSIIGPAQTLSPEIHSPAHHINNLVESPPTSPSAHFNLSQEQQRPHIHDVNNLVEVEETTLKSDSAYIHPDEVEHTSNIYPIPSEEVTTMVDMVETTLHPGLFPTPLTLNNTVKSEYETENKTGEDILLQDSKLVDNTSRTDILVGDTDDYGGSDDNLALLAIAALMPMFTLVTMTLMGASLIPISIVVFLSTIALIPFLPIVSLFGGIQALLVTIFPSLSPV